MSATAPNFVVFLVDQLPASHLGCYGNHAIATSAIDTLAAEGCVFERAYVANPVCMPNRATIATGRWPSMHGTDYNGITLNPDSSTVWRALLAGGWQTVAVGKLHYQTMGWPWEPFQAEEIARVSPLLLDGQASDAVRPARARDWDSYENAARHRLGFVALPTDYYGFAEVDLVVGHGDRATGHYTSWARSKGLDPDEVSGVMHSRHAYPEWDQVYRTEIPAELYPTSYVVERTVAQLERLAANGRPFALLCSFPDPHHPFTPPGRYWDMYDPMEMPIPPSFADTHAAAPDHILRMVARRGEPHLDSTMPWAPTEQQLRHALAAEFGALTMIDDGIAKVMTALHELGLDGTTTVIFASDHGDMFGAHGLMLKHFVHYESVVRVPLIIRGPTVERGRTQALVSSADFAPTLLELAGVQAYRGIQGRSLVPLLTARAQALRERLLVEEDQPFGIEGLPAPVRIRTLITERERLTLYAGRSFGELYDLEADPEELENLWSVPERFEMRAALTRALAEEMACLVDPGVVPAASA